MKKKQKNKKKNIRCSKLNSFKFITATTEFNLFKLKNALIVPSKLFFIEKKRKEKKKKKKQGKPVAKRYHEVSGSLALLL